MSAQHLTATIAEDGVLLIRDPRLRCGDVVDVVVVPTPTRMAGGQDRSRQLLGATPYSYADPTAPVAEGEWEALR